MNLRELTLLLIAGGFVAITASGCGLFDSDDEDDNEDAIPSSLVIANGGNFSDQNGSLTFYDAEAGTTTDLTDLGAFAHSLTLRDGMAYVSLNTFATGRVDVVDLSNGAVVQQIEVPAPRSTVFVDGGTLLATNLSNFGASGPEPGILSRISLGSGTVEPLTTVGLYPEGIVVVGSTAYVANSGNLGDGTTLSVVDLGTEAEERIELGCDGPNEIFVDGEGELVVVCAGKTVYNEDFSQIIEETNGQILFVNPASRQIVDRIELNLKPVSASEAQTAYLEEGSGELYVIADPTDEILRFDTSENALETRIDVPDVSGLTGLAALAYDGESELLYVARLAAGPGGVSDFTSSGAVLVLDRAGSQVDRFPVGPAPTHIEIID